MIDTIITTFIMFFVIISPLSNMLIFERLTESYDKQTKKKTALKSVLIGFFVLMFFGLTGDNLFKILGIGVDAFRLGGGLLLFLISIDMVFEKRVQRRSESADKIVKDTTFEDISVFPMAIPLMAGPGSITTTILAIGRYHNDIRLQLLVFAILGVVSLISFLLYIYSSFFIKMIGETINTTVSRLLGIILTAISVQFVIDGIKGAFSL